MGKKIIIDADFSENAIITGSLEINLTALQGETYSINVDKWGSNTGNKHVTIAVQDTWRTISLTTNDERGTYIAFLKSYSTPTAGGTMDFCNGQNRGFELLRSTKYSYTIPQDCTHIVITKETNNLNQLPSLFKVYY